MIAADNITATLLLFSLFFLERIQQQQQNNTILSSVRIRTQMSLFLSPFRFCFIFVMLRFCLSCILYALHLTWHFLITDDKSNSFDILGAFNEVVLRSVLLQPEADASAQFIADFLQLKEECTEKQRELDCMLICIKYVCVFM